MGRGVKAGLKTEKPRKTKGLAALAALLGGFGGCATLVEAPPADPIPPEYAFAAHPDGWDEADLHSIFYDKKSPSLASLKGCDSDFRKLRAATRSNEEFQEGLKELVTKDPVGYHWCFYGQLAWLDEELKELKYADEKQKKVLKTFEFLTPIARIFTAQFNDSRYLRWAVLRYKHLSDWVFFRKLALTPRTTAELVEMSNPYGLVRPPVGSTQVLDKYRIEPKPLFTPGALETAVSGPPTAPVAEPAAPASAVEPGTPPAAQAEQPVPPPTAPEAAAPAPAASSAPADPVAAVSPVPLDSVAPPPSSGPPDTALPPTADVAAPADPGMEAPPLPGDSPSARAPAGQPAPPR